LLLGVAAGGRDRGREIKLRFAPYGARLDQAPQRHAQVVIRLQRLIDQAVQGVIAELRPEFPWASALEKAPSLAPSNFGATLLSGFT